MQPAAVDKGVLLFMSSLQMVPTKAVLAPKKTVQDLYRTLGDAIAAVIESPDCPEILRGRLYEFVADIANDAEQADSSGKAAADARFGLPIYFEIIGAKS